MQCVWVSGEPATFFTATEAEWKGRLVEALSAFALPSECGLHLEFVVTTWRRRGHLFDIDNLAKPVLDALGRPDLPFLEVEARLGLSPGVRITPSLITSRHVAPELWIEALPRGSVRNAAIHPSLTTTPPIPRNNFLRVHLHVHEDDLITNFGFDGFVKPILDRLWPLLGGTAHMPEDHRVKHLIITRSYENRSGVSIGIERIE